MDNIEFTSEHIQELSTYALREWHDEITWSIDTGFVTMTDRANKRRLLQQIEEELKLREQD